jgi:hypothetical protein
MVSYGECLIQLNAPLTRSHEVYPSARMNELALTRSSKNMASKFFHVRTQVKLMRPRVTRLVM